MKELEVVKDQWAFGKDNTVMHRGQRFFEENDEAARIWVGMGVAKYVEPPPVRTRVMTTENAEALIESRDGGRRGRYARRDLRARD
jgi:hypothetical protein